MILLITGGTGSFGKAALKRFLSNNFFQEIRVFSRDEKKQDDIRKEFNSERIKFYLGDVRDYDSVVDAMIGVNYVFHAAALKQVPSCEFFPMEAVKTNVIGTKNVIAAADKCGVYKIICLSTDKAAYPINAMGISKAMMEKVAIAMSRNSKTIVCITRYGNVMGSRGSVIPLFMEKIRQKQPLTITDPNMTRFLMSLEEAVELVWFAFENGNSGDLFVHKAPSCTINDLAKALKTIFNHSLDDIIIGTRHGEKLFETLCTREEISKAIDEGRNYRIPADNRDLNYESFNNLGSVIEQIDDYNSHNTERLSVEEIILKVKSAIQVENG
jgi:UDP-N-acetylglucosamine 4,6-dehydratase/5-epimerase